MKPDRSARILVTGGKGFLGWHLCERLRLDGYQNVIPLSIEDCDLSIAAEVNACFKLTNPDVVIHLAAAVGGIGANIAQAGYFSYANTIMGANIIEACRIFSVRKLVIIGTICLYPEDAPIPTPEKSMWDGFPALDTAAYGIAKRNLWVMSWAYRKQYGLNSIFLIPTNLYGPGDHFEPDKSHVIAALIRRMSDATRNSLPEVVVWGDGSATRDFLFVTDAANGIALALEHYNDERPLNLGSGCETSIRELAILIARISHYEGRIVWDQTKPTGAPRRFLDVSRANKEIGFIAATQLDDGLKQTIEWFALQSEFQPKGDL
ncbi:MAG: GDP-L-fucose synthase [Calditrichaeota bacterium]|nr:GDP-L-fucose synthase [Calditrichota bacterium]